MRAKRKRPVSSRGEPYRLLFELNPSPMFVFDEQTLRFLAVNQAMVQHYGWSRAQLARMTIEDIRPPDEVPRLRAALRRLKDLRTDFLGAWRQWRKDGTLLDVELTVSSVRFGNRAARLTVVSDITERKRAENALQTSMERLKRAEEIAHLGSWELDPVNDRLTWSDEVYRIFGLPPQEFGGTYAAFLDCVHRDDRALVDAAYVQSLEAGRNTYELEHRVVRKDTGEIRVVHEKCEHFRDSQGRIIRSVGMVHDITERKRAEEALRRLATELEQRVQARTAELQLANSSLRREMSQRRHLERQVLEISEREQRRIGQDLHDGLGQRLAAARYQLGALRLQLAKQHQPAARRAERIEGDLLQALAETRQLARGLHPVRPDPEGLMSALHELAQSMTAAFGIPCRLEGAHQVLIPNHHVATNLYRIAQEAISNAVRHGHPKHVRILLKQAEAGIQLRIEDDGCGLPAAKPRSEGLGVAIMRYRASVIGATFAIAGQPGAGTVVTCNWQPLPQETDDITRSAIH